MALPQKDLFLCHNKADKEWVRQLGSRIEAEKLGGRSLSVFLDEWDIEPGDNILLKINEGLKQSRFVAVVLSPEMLSSDWCALEFTAVLAQDPTNKQGRLLPLLLRDTDKQTSARIELPPIIMPLNFLDFRRPEDFEKALARLLGRVRGEPSPRGPQPLSRPNQTEAVTSPLARALGEGRADPDPIAETLVSNLLPVISMPAVVWTAPTKLKAKSDIPDGRSLPAFTLKAERIVSFADLSSAEGPFIDFLTSGEWSRHTVLEWSKSPDKWGWIIEIMNTALRSHLHRHGIHFEFGAKRFYFARQSDKSVRLQWGTGDLRTVVRAPDADHPDGNWVHQAARLRFETLGSNVFLSVEPTWMFTTDGRQPVAGRFTGPLVMSWGGKERNGAILRNVLMWSEALAWGKRQASIPTGDKPIVVGRAPVLVGTTVGLADDHVNMRSLLKFTKAEQDLEVPADEPEPTFGYVDEDIDGSEDGADGP